MGKSIAEKKLISIDLLGDVDGDLFKSMISQVQKKFVDGITERIHVNLMTHGGEVYAALAIYDYLKSTNAEIIMFCHGAVMSAGTVILMAGHKRVAMPNTHLLVHYGSEFVDSELTAKHNQHLTKVLKGIIKEGCGISSRKVNQWFKGETYFTAIESVREGLIHEIYGE